MMKDIELSRAVVISGAFRWDNFGDTLMLQLTVNWINNLGYKALIYNCTQRTANQIRGDAEIFNWKKHMRDAIALIYTGGGYLGEGPSTSFRWHTQLLKQQIPICLAFKIAGKPYGVVGAGVGPLKYRVSRCAIGWLANGAKVNVVRDQESWDHLVAFGGLKSKTVVTADMVLNGELLQMYPVNTDSDPHAEPYGVVHFTHTPDADHHQAEVCSLIRNFLIRTPNSHVIAISDNPSKHHARVAESIFEYLGHDSSTVQIYESPEQVCKLIGKARFVLTNKLHVGVVATAYGSPTYGIADHPKTERFFRQMGRLKFWCPRTKPNSEGLTKFLDEAWAGRVLPAPGLANARKATEENRLFIEQIISAGRRK